MVGAEPEIVIAMAVSLEEQRARHHAGAGHLHRTDRAPCAARGARPRVLPQRQGLLRQQRVSKFVEMEADDSGSEDEMDNSNFPDVNSDGNVCDLIASTTDDKDATSSLRPSASDFRWVHP